MKKIITSFFILINSILFFTGCSSGEPKVANHYRFDIIDSVLSKNNGKIYARLTGININEFIDYNLISFDYITQEKDFKDTVYFFVISRKNIVEDTNYYYRLTSGKSYDMSLEKIDTLFKARVAKTFDRGGGETRIIEPDLIYWKNGKFVIKLYFSNEIKDIYIKK